MKKRNLCPREVYKSLCQQVPERVQIGRFAAILPTGPVSLADTYFVAAGEFEREDFRKAIRNALQSHGLQPVYLMESQVSSGTALAQLIRDIQTARFGIYRIDAQASANSFLALGIAIGLNRPWLLVAREGAEIPADVRGLSSIDFGSFTQLEELFVERSREFLRRWAVTSAGEPVATGSKKPYLPRLEYFRRFPEKLDMPGGAVRLGSSFYVERRADAHLKREVVKSGTTTMVRLM